MNDKIILIEEWRPKAGLNVLTGVNGGGKTKILDRIYKSIQCRNMPPSLPPTPYSGAYDEHNKNIKYLEIKHDFEVSEYTNIPASKVKIEYLPVLWRTYEDIISLEVCAFSTGEPLTGSYAERQRGDNSPIAGKIDVLKKINQIMKEFSKKVNEQDELIGKMKLLPGTDLAIDSILAQLKEDNPGLKLQKATKALGDFFRFNVVVPNLEDIRDGNLELKLTDYEGKEFKNDDISSGERVILYMLLMEQLGEFGVLDILLVDELDAHLNPALAKEYVRIINSISISAQVFLVTHNPIVANLIAEDNLWWVEKGEVNHVPRKPKREIINHLADGLFTADEIQGVFSLFARNEDVRNWIILVEGKNDQTTALREFLSGYKDVTFEIINCKGANNIAMFSNLPYRENHLQQKSPQKILCIFDNDIEGANAGVS